MSTRALTLGARSILIVFAAVAVCATANSAHAQHPSRSHATVEGYFIGDFLGEYRLRVEGERRSSGDIDLDPTLGGGLRVGMQSGIFAAGLMTEFRGYGNDEYNDRDFVFDVSPYIGVRIPLVDHGGTRMRLRGTVPLGFSVLKPRGDVYGDERYLGFNTGALGGLELVFGNVGLFTDVGVRYHRVYASEDLGPLGDVKANLSWAQLSVNAGLHLEF
ncbi:MAG: hypothetical protein KC668_17745 [Myxococcales bacterium]|nr:hypothetical protein [Myxococcales bacterium]